jgi:AcrR family transcriptional regulator
MMDARDRLPAGLGEPDPCTARRAGRPRSEACRLAVLAAAYDVLTREGLAGFTIERVAAAASVGRTTIYRWWPSRGALAVECLLEAVQKQYRAGASGDVTEDLKAHMRQVVEIMRGEAGRVVASIIAEGQRDPGTLAAFEAGFLRPRRRDLEKILALGLERGQLRHDLDIDMTIDLLIGGMLRHLLSTGGLADARLAERIVDTITRGCLPETARH